MTLQQARGNLHETFGLRRPSLLYDGAIIL
jgi:hypothetical protein